MKRRPECVVRDSEEPARDALDRFRQVVYEKALQGKIDAVEAAFPPPVSAATGKPKRHKGRQAYSLLTVNGRLRLKRVRWHCALDGSETLTDCLLDEVEATISEDQHNVCRLVGSRRPANYQE